MVMVLFITDNAEFQEAIVEFDNTRYVTELIYLEHIRDNLYFVNALYLAPLDTCLWCI